MAESNLFEEFEGATFDTWKAEAERELKGKSFDEFLVWNTTDGVSVDAYYDNTSNSDLPPFTANTRPNSYWDITAEVIIEDDIAKANKHALEALQGGASAIRFVGNYLSDQKEMEALLEGIQIEIIGLHFDCGEANPLIYYMLQSEVENRGLTMQQMNVVIGYDPLGNYTLRGYADYPEQENFKVAASLINTAVIDGDSVKVLTVNGRHFHNAGASAVQELAMVLAQAAEYFTRLTDLNISAQAIADRLQINLSVGSSYFVEIAKMRALQVLWDNLLNAYGAKGNAFVTAETSKWNKSIYSAQTNMLRDTTEVMAAVIGGCNAFVVEPFDAAYKKPDTFSRRIARNVQLVAKYESFFR